MTENRADGLPQVGTIGFVALVEICAVSTGLALISATVIGVDAVRDRQPPTLTPALYLLFAGTLAGILVATSTAWWLLGPIMSTYRRGGLAMVSGFATVLLMLICIPIHQLLGRTGLITLMFICLITAVFLGRQARRLVMNP